MAEFAGTISRQALGRVAWLGDLYDATHERFCATSVFKNSRAPSRVVNEQENHYSNISVTTTDSVEEKLNALDVNAELKVSVLSGMVDLGGSAKYLTERKDSFRSVESTLVYNVHTVMERIDLFNSKVRDHISPNALSVSRVATHVVVGIYWGANCTVTVAHQNSEDEDRKEVEASVTAHVEKLKAAVSAGGEVGAKTARLRRDNWGRFSLRIFGDIQPKSFDEFPTSVDGAVELLRKMPNLVRKSNDSKGKPLKYVLFPLSSLPLQQLLADVASKGSNHQSVETQTPYSSLDEGQIIRVTHLFGHITELRQKAHDYYSELSGHCRAITREEELTSVRETERDLEVQEGCLKSELKDHLIGIRSDSKTNEDLETLCKTHRDKANETFQKCEEIYKAEKQQIVFAKRCTKFGARYLERPIGERIASACDQYENVYVLFDGEVDSENNNGSQTDGEKKTDCKIETNHSLFVELARCCQNDKRSACYVARPEPRKSGGVRIERYLRGKRIQQDVAKDLQEMKDKNLHVAQCTAARRPYCQVPFRARCPGSTAGKCDREERVWSCAKCTETLQFSLVDRALCCACGHAKASQFQFRCASEHHGSHFIPLPDDMLQSVLHYHESFFYAGNYVAKLITKKVKV